VPRVGDHAAYAGATEAETTAQFDPHNPGCPTCLPSLAEDGVLSGQHGASEVSRPPDPPRPSGCLTCGTAEIDPGPLEVAGQLKDDDTLRPPDPPGPSGCLTCGTAEVDPGPLEVAGQLEDDGPSGCLTCGTDRLDTSAAFQPTVR
jgi:hypothetical protein